MEIQEKERKKYIQEISLERAYSYIDREFQSLAVQEKKLIDIDILVTSTNGDRKIIQSIKITSRPPSRIRKWKQLSQFR